MNAKPKHAPLPAPGIDRREFLRLSGMLAAATALGSAGCQVPQETTVPFNDMPEELVDGIGHARFFHTVLDGSPVVVKTREGRPILVTPSSSDGSGRGLSVRHHAALMDIYDPDRARGPLSVRRSKGALVASSWPAISAQVLAQLKAAGSRAVLLTGPSDSPALAAAIAALAASSDLKHIVWSPLSDDTVAAVWKQAFGTAGRARPRLDKADLILGLGAEILDRPEDGLERDFAVRRTPDGPQGMNRFVQLEGRLTLTGANADQRLRVRDSQLAEVAAALAHQLIIADKLGPLAGDSAVAQALAPYSIAAVAARAGIAPAALTALAAQLRASAGGAVVVAGGSADGAASGPQLELATILLNLTVGAFEAGLLEESPSNSSLGTVTDLAALVDDMTAGRIEMLIIAGANPVYDAPAPLAFSAALTKVPLVVSLNDRLDETSLLADLLAPTSHPFECWGDAALPRGMFAIQQPVIQPLFDTRGLLDVIVEWAAALGDPTAAAAVTAAAAAGNNPRPPAATAEPAPSPSVAYHYLRAAWATRLGVVAGRAFDQEWEEVLRSGGWQGQTPAAAPHRLSQSALAILHTEPNPPSGVELQLYPHYALADGRKGNNGWLHELPDPITRLTWGGALSIAPRRFDEMNLVNGDLIEVDTGQRKLVVPAYRHAGMHYDQVALPLGLGRQACGAIGADIGVNAFPMRQLAEGRVLSAGLPVTLRKLGSNEPLALAQGADVLDREARPLLPVTTLSAYQANARAGTEQPEGGRSAWPEHEYKKARWAMAIDLSKCNGCGKCVIGCQAENNVPVVGRHGILDGREMSWMRIDRYYDAPPKEAGWDDQVWDAPLAVVEEPQTMFEPMLCQHCENAPCETVCPFVATMHSEEGLNQQIYNRCVGTRYCANNCPFKVRRYNFWEYSKRQDSSFFRWLVPRIARNAELNTRAPMQMKNNPEVTVRSRGVMEKCSFCIQRVRSASAQATRDGKDKTHYPDGAVVPACMEACPAGAITFGDANAPGARVAALAESPRAMKLLDSLGVKPSISYLSKVRNDKV